MAQTGRSDDGGLLVDVENVEAVAVPLRRSADGALVADWGQVPARVYVAGLAGDGHRTMTACLQAIAAWVSGGEADIDTLPWARLRFSHTTAIRAALARLTAVLDDLRGYEATLRSIDPDLQAMEIAKVRAEATADVLAAQQAGAKAAEEAARSSERLAAERTGWEVERTALAGCGKTPA